MSGTAAAPSPSWADESLAVVAARRRLAGAVVLVLGVVAIVVTLVAPGVLPPNALVGAAVAIAALLLGVAAVLAVDAADLVVRGVRHVHAAGAQVAATVSPDAEDVHALQAIVGRRARGGRVRVGVVAASRSAGAPGARAAALAETLARTGKRVLLTDLTRGPSGNAGLSDVIAGTHRLRDVVHFDEGIYLGRVAVGTDKQAALAGYDDWVTHLPSDLEVLVTVLPPLADPQVLDATVGMDVVFLQVEIDRTERVDLLASLDALDAVDQSCEIVLVDPTRGSPRTGAVSSSDEPTAEESAAGESAGGESIGDGAVEDEAVDDESAGDEAAEGESIGQPLPGADDLGDDPDEQTGSPEEARARAADEPATDTPEDVTSIDRSGVPGAVGTASVAAAAGAPWDVDDDAGDQHGPGSSDEVADAAAPVDEPSGAPEPAGPDADEPQFVRPLGATPPPRGNALPEELLPASTSSDTTAEDDDPDATRELPRIERPDVGTSSPSAAETPERGTRGDAGDRWLDPRAVWSDLPTRRPEASDTGAQEDDASADADLVDIGDDVTGEAVRTAAALQALAQQVWSRED